MGGVYRIQTVFGFLYFFYIYKAPYDSTITATGKTTEAVEEKLNKISTKYQNGVKKTKW